MHVRLREVERGRREEIVRSEGEGVAEARGVRYDSVLSMYPRKTDG